MMNDSPMAATTPRWKITNWAYMKGLRRVLSMAQGMATFAHEYRMPLAGVVPGNPVGAWRSPPAL
jgi:hypothetical protein